MMVLEICCADIVSVAAALDGGAGRIELCSSLETGGLTPSVGLVESTVALCADRIPVNVLIRPRSGDFLYSGSELLVMLSDIAAVVNAGASGIVIGALTECGHVDMESCAKMIAEAKVRNPHVSVTFHRAFDLCCDPEQALRDVIELGCDRILTSGLAASALDGAPVLRRLQRLAEGRMVIMGGAGVGSHNIERLVNDTGITEVHASAKTTVCSGMKFRREDVAMGQAGADEYSRFVTSACEVRRMAEILSKISS